VDAHVDGHWDATRPAGPFGRRMGFLFYSVGATARPSDRSSPPRTESGAICGPQSPPRGVPVRYVKNGLLPRAAKKGMLEKAEQGNYPSFAPLGYINVQCGDKRFIQPTQSLHL